ncbi:hypothetical protein [uncultured Desulfosarcina sp.]|uniref:hypothetical protein n=1 Tax=uncultured Desulfosarcina sp. TaxID=218289 RepID=UPI0029C76073|nr:hypothetical protein [uncultured Desulfosarcina sp.]
MNRPSVLFRATTFFLVTALALGTGFFLPVAAEAGPPVRGSARVSVHHGGPGGHGGGAPHGGGGNHNTNVNVNVNHGGPGPGGPPPHHHNDGAAIVAGAITGLAVGAIVAAASMPPSCVTVVVNNVSYRQCGSTWYQPYYAGTEVQYVVVDPPR